MAVKLLLNPAMTSMLIFGAFFCVCCFFRFTSASTNEVTSRTRVNSLDSVEKEQLSMELLMNLTEESKYNKNIRPPTGNDSSSYEDPLLVYHSAYVYYISSLSPSSTQYSIQMLLRQKWRDPRLAFHEQLNSSEWEGWFDLLKVYGDRIILDGDDWLADRIWTPNVFFVNEHDSSVFDLTRKNVYVAIDSEGTVFFNLRLRVEFYCEIDLTLFPFDEQVCRLKMESWSLTDAHLILKWFESNHNGLNAVEVSDEFFMAEYDLRKITCRAEIFDYPHHILEATSPARRLKKRSERHLSVLGNTRALLTGDHRVGDASLATSSRVLFKEGNYSGLIVELHFSRVFQHYILDYYVPSLFLVMTSWVSFWLDPNAAPARVTLGTSTMLTFITLARNTEGSLPKVAYIKSIEVWFFGCITFIFLTLVEFSLVHGIQLSRKEIYEVKRATPKHIIRRAISPAVSRKNSDGDISQPLSRRSSPPDLRKTISVPNLSSLAAQVNPKSTFLSVYDNPAFISSGNNLFVNKRSSLGGEPRSQVKGSAYDTVGSLDSVLSYPSVKPSGGNASDSEGEDSGIRTGVLKNPSGFDKTGGDDGWPQISEKRTSGGTLESGSLPENQTTENLRQARERLRNSKMESRKRVFNRLIPEIFAKKSAPTIVVVGDADQNDHGKRHHKTHRVDPPISPKKAAKIIDQYSRWMFPLLFGVFNAFYWSYVALS